MTSPALYSKGGKAKNAVTLGIDEGFQKASSLGQRARAVGQTRVSPMIVTPLPNRRMAWANSRPI